METNEQVIVNFIFANNILNKSCSKKSASDIRRMVKEFAREDSINNIPLNEILWSSVADIINNR